MTADLLAWVATPLSPALVLFCGALCLFVLRRRLPRHLLLAASISVVLAALSLLLWLVGSRQAGELVWTWDPVGLPGGSWHWQLDGQGVLASGLLLLLGLVAMLVHWDEPQACGQSLPPSALALLAAALLFVSSVNLLTLALSWVALDVAIGLWSAVTDERINGRFLALNGLGALLLVVGLVFAGPEGAREPLTAGLEPLAVLALLLAALLRCAAYPVHVGLLHRRGQTGSLLLWRLVWPVAGLWMLAHACAMLQPYWGPQSAWAGLGVLGMLAAALLAWLAEEPAERVAWVTIGYVGQVVLIAAWRAEQGVAAVLWALPALTLGVGCLIVGQAINRRWGWRYPLALGTATLVGLPGTPGFIAWLGLWPSTGPSLGDLPLWILALLGQALLAAALLAELGRREQRPTTNGVPLGVAARLLAATILLSAVLIVGGVLPPLVARLTGLPADEALFRGLVAQVAEVSPLTWVSLVVPWGMGALLAWRRSSLLAGQRDWQETLASVASLEWGYRALEWCAERTAPLLRGLGAVVEGEGYLGWLAVALFLSWLLMHF